MLTVLESELHLTLPMRFYIEDSRTADATCPGSFGDFDEIGTMLDDGLKVEYDPFACVTLKVRPASLRLGLSHGSLRIAHESSSLFLDSYYHRTKPAGPYDAKSRVAPISRGRVHRRRCRRSCRTRSRRAHSPYVLGGAVIVEQVFNWPGMGRLAWQAALDRDYPVLLGITLVAALVIRAGHMLKEATQVAVNPQHAS